MARWAVEIDRDDIRDAALVTEHEGALPAGAIEVAIDLIALTANNVTYAALGKPTGLLGPDVGYWDFFGDRDAPGRLPVWGYATVTRSDVEGIAVGEAFYGYWPLASHAVLLPMRVGRVGFTDAMPRRQALPPFYNNYQRVAALDGYRPKDHDWWPVFRPLYVTGWLVADQLADECGQDAEQVLVTAASSKTALGFAHAMRAQGDAPRLVALTSERSADFVRASGLYDDIVLYDSIPAMAGDVRSVLVDFANAGAVTRAVHDRFGDALALDLVVGFTHWDAGTEAGTMPGPRRTGFFAPGRLQKRGGDWGAEELRRRMGDSWDGFLRDAPRLATLERRQGGEAALAAYRAAVAGEADPRVGVLISR